MWSLPDIQRLNSDARTGKHRLCVQRDRINQGNATEAEKCEHCGERATSAMPWYDIFSANPKGLLLQCDHCRDRYGTPEGCFYCSGCDRIMIENYTWEIYRHIADDGDMLCLPCYAKRELADEDNWIQLTDEDIAVVTFEVVRKAKHLIGVRMPIPKGIRFFGNVGLDSATGGELRTTMHADATPDAGVQHLRDVLIAAKEEGHKRAILILDGAYQFAVSIGVYVDAPAPEPKRKRRTLVA